MRLLPALMLGFALPGVALVATAPVALAKEKEKAAAAQYSPAFIQAVQPLQKAVQAKDWAGAKSQIDAVEAKASTPDDKYAASSLRYQIGASTDDNTQLKQGILGMLDSGRASPEALPQLEGMAGQFALQGGDADGAIQHLEKAVAFPGVDPQFFYILAESYFSKGVKQAGGKITPETQPLFIKGLGYLQQGIDGLKAAGKPVPAAYYDRGSEIALAVKAPDAAKWALASVQQNGSPAAWYSLLTGYQDAHPTLPRGEQLDLYRLMAQAGAIRSASEYSEYADLALKSGLVGEVKASIDQGRAAGKVQPTQINDLYGIASGQIAKDRASLPASEADAAKAPNGKLAVSTADAYLGYGDNAKAAALYRLGLQKGGVDANEVNTRLGIALARSGDTAGATAAFAAVSAGTRKDIAGMWALWLKNRGS